MKHGTFICTKTDGKLKIYDRAGFDAVLADYGDGEDLQLSIEDVGRKRTQAQNRFFHGPILDAFKPLGWHKQEAKDMLCLRFIPRECRLLDGSIVQVPGHTSDLKVDEFNDLIDQCIQLAAEQDDRAIENIDEKIAALQLARQHLIDQQRKTPTKRTRPVAAPTAAKEA